MDVKLLLICTIFLSLLLGSCNGSTGSKEMPAEIPTKTTDHHHHHSDIHTNQQVHSDSHSSPHMHPIDSTLTRLFHLQDLNPGNTMSLHFPNDNLSDVFAHTLSKHESDSIPFSSRQLHNLLNFFSFPQDSPIAIAMKKTLDLCEKQPMNGETKSCITSKESMMDFIRMIFGPRNQPKFHSTVHLTKSDALLQQYTIMVIKRLLAPKMIPCHNLVYPYAVFYCHYQEGENRVYKVRLTGDNGDKVKAIAVCHMDTSHWSHNHMSFQVLGTKPGPNSPVCHFFRASDFIWVPRQA